MEIKKLIDTFRPPESRETGSKTNKGGSPSGNSAHQGDRVSLSPGAQTFRDVLATADASSGVRTERVEQLKQQVESNTYKVDSRKTAEKMLEQEYSSWGRQI